MPPGATLVNDLAVAAKYELVAENPPTQQLYGCMHDKIVASDDSIDEPMLPATEYQTAGPIFHCNYSV